MTKHALAAIVSLCFGGSCGLVGGSTGFEWRLSLPITSFQDPVCKLL